jgi:hypothetical protein
MMAADTTTARLPTPFSLWFGVLVPPLAWSVHLLLGYLLVALQCQTGNPLYGTWLLALLTIGTLLLDAAAGVLAFLARSGPDDQSRLSAGRRSFMGTSGALLSVLFGVLIIAGGIPELFLSPC